MDIGLEAAGFEHLGSVEIDPIPRQTLRMNRPWHLLGDGDINEVATWLSPSYFGIERGELSLLAGGPPCQPFSAAAQWARNGRRGLLDERARTIDGLLSMVESFLPRVILMENVVGFVQGSHSALDYLESELEKIGRRFGVKYSTNFLILNAADYGVPQNRRRAIIVFLRDGEEFLWPEPTHSTHPLTAWDVLYDLKPDDAPVATGKWSSLLPAIPPGQNYQWLTARGGGQELFGYRTKFWNFLLKLSPDLPAWTLSASPGPATGPFHWENRPLAVSEQLRIQSFPDDWRLAGDFRDQTKQVGNATPPLLAEVIGHSLLDALGEPRPTTPTLGRKRSTYAAPELTYQENVPAHFLPQIGKKEAHLGTGQGPAPRPANL